MNLILDAHRRSCQACREASDYCPTHREAVGLPPDDGAPKCRHGFKYAHTQVTLGVAEDCSGPA